MTDYLESPCSSETDKPGLPFVTPPPLDDVLRGIDNLDVPSDAQLPPSIYGSFPTYRDTSEPTDSTGLTEDIHNTEYSFPCSFLTRSTSNHPSLFDLALRDILDSECNYIDPQHNSVLPDTSESTFRDSSGTQLLQHDHVIESPAPADDGLYRPPVGVSPQSLFTTFHISPPAVPTDPPVDPALTTENVTGPIRTKPTCRECGRGKHNFYHIFSRYSMFLSSL